MNRLTWAEITQRYRCQWMLLAETEDDGDGNSRSVRTCPDDETR
jgi:hypothetical protein